MVLGQDRVPSICTMSNFEKIKFEDHFGVILDSYEPKCNLPNNLEYRPMIQNLI
jgi:hypothetical protein